MSRLEQSSEKTISEKFLDTRKRTLELVKTLEKDDFIVQTAEYMSPPKWHLGHVSWLFEIVLSKTQKNYEVHSKEFSYYLNSYYNQFGKPLDKGKRGLMSRPTTDEILDYYNIITEKITNTLQKSKLDQESIYLYKMAINHECQHQELLLYDLQNLLADSYRPVKKNMVPKMLEIKSQSVGINGGIYELGYSGNDYCFDIELPEHKIYLNDYKIDTHPVTNQQYMEFMSDGGYTDYSLWLSDGWDSVKKNNWSSPMYWEKEDEEWFTRDFIGRRKINLKEPVKHVSYYEAAAFAKWTKKRLPTEAEWEKAALWNEEKQRKTIFPWGNETPTSDHANLLESCLWNCAEIGSYDKGKSPNGCYQMIGDIWEWTSSEFMGYPGFKSGFDEYNDKWFTNQKVLRGGSFATPTISIRGSYRNFFRLDERWMFSGFRCVEDV